MLAIAFASGTFAAWTDSATIGGGTFTSGTLDLQVNNGDSHVTTTLGMTAMVPGSTSTEVIVVKNAGTAPLKYSLQGGLTGADAAAYNTCRFAEAHRRAERHPSRGPATAPPARAARCSSPRPP